MDVVSAVGAVVVTVSVGVAALLYPGFVGRFGCGVSVLLSALYNHFSFSVKMLTIVLIVAVEGGGRGWIL